MTRVQLGLPTTLAPGGTCVPSSVSDKLPQQVIGGRDASGATTFPVARLARAVSRIQLLKSLLSLSLASFWFSAPRNLLWRPLSFREPVDAQRRK